jgi:hypothetical protein
MVRISMRSLGQTLLIAALLAAPVMVRAQGRSSSAVLGRVTEAGSGRAISGATVTARERATGSEQQATSAIDGVFFLTSLLPGRHAITAACGGFEPASLADLPIRAGDPTLPEPQPVLLALRRAGQLSPRSAGPAREGNGSPSRQEIHLEARVRWETQGSLHRGEPVPQPATGADRFTVIAVHRYPGARPRQRTPELSEEQILVITADARGEPRAWTLVTDPGLIRAERPGPDGGLTGETHRLARAELLVTLPADPQATGLRFYRPRWTGALFALDLLGTAGLLAHPAAAGERSESLTPSPER